MGLRAANVDEYDLVLETLGVSVVVNIACTDFTDDRSDAFEIGFVEFVCGDCLRHRGAALAAPDSRLLALGVLLLQLLPCRTKTLY